VHRVTRGGLFGIQIPFLKLLGARAEHWERGRAVVSLELRKELTNSWGSAHGGIVTTLLDVAMGGAAMSADVHATGVVTVSLTVSFLRSAVGSLVAEGRMIKGGRSLAFCEGEVRDAAGEVLAKGVGTFKVKRRGEGGAAG
jgi:uncharacterized protein (TIGR00369 family)